ncbi:MAG: polyisoprenyl-teichoic acid--peptidoglycan teichoic acid transferase [Actinomycetota bacterium]|nr:polyisoprenyl-teichoic acid--peptidoglycan teichoic acid transferase [Actinomycetota bacterium]
MPDNLGPRREALKSRRAQARRRRVTGGGVAAIVAGLLAAGGIAYLATDGEPVDTPRPQPSVAGKDSVTSTLVFGTREQGGGALWLTLLTYDNETESGSVVYIPAHTAVEVPGRGLQGLGAALESGGPPLLLVSTENLLGIDIDSYLEISDRDARVLFEATGPLSVDVPSEVKIAIGNDRARLLFDAGQQQLGASFLVQLLYIRGLDSDDIDLGGRHLAFWDALFDSFADDPDNLAAAVKAAGGSLVESDVDVGQHAKLLATLAGLDIGQRTLTTLPVQQVSVGGSELYQANRDEIAALMDDLLSGASSPQKEIAVQVLNGNGVPGIGQEVAAKLIAAGFRVVLTGNARRLNYEKTLVITYDDSEEGQALAERARKLIGVGEVQISGQSQGIVALTIVIGKDFLRTH